MMTTRQQTYAPSKPGEGIIWVVSLPVLALFHGLFFALHYMGRASVPNDFALAYYSVPAYWQTSIMAGEWPHWLPYQSFGYPFAANPQTGLFYPPFWIFVLFRIPYTLAAANIFQCLHIYVGSIGFLLLARTVVRSPWTALVGALSFQLFGGLFSNAQHSDIIRGYAWIPWILWASSLPGIGSKNSAAAAQPDRRLARRTLLLPPLLFLFITGSYPGVVVATLTIAVPFIAAQFVMRTWPERLIGRAVFEDAGIIAALFAAGIVASAVFLLPTGFFARYLVRAHVTFADIEQVRFFVLARDLWNLLFSTVAVGSTRPSYGRELSMLGMQIPVVVLLFLPYCRRSDLTRLVPFFVPLVPAAIMCAAPLSSLRHLLTAVIPPLGWSRFPAGDYRLYIWLALLMPSLCGIEAFFMRARKGEGVRLLVPAVFASAALAILAWWASTTVVQPEFSRYMRHGLRMQAIAAVGALALALLTAFYRVPRLAFSLLMCVAAFASSFNLQWDFRFLWLHPNLAYYQYELNGIRLAGDSGLAVQQVFKRTLESRPPRTLPDPKAVASRGYITGEFLPGDQGHARTVWRDAVESNAPLRKFMMGPTQMKAFACAAVPCGGPDAVTIDLARADGGSVLSYRPLRYARNSVSYHVTLAAPALVVENEIFAPGWTAYAGSTQLRPRIVNEALRGWVLPAGSYELREEYRTPLLPLSAGISVAGFAAWGFLWRAQRSRFVPGPAVQHNKATIGAASPINKVRSGSGPRRSGPRRSKHG